MGIRLTKVLLSEGQIIDQEIESIEKIIENVKKQREWLHSQIIDDLLDFFEKLGKYWAETFSNEIGINSKHLISFLSKKKSWKKIRNCTSW